MFLHAYDQTLKVFQACFHKKTKQKIASFLYFKNAKKIDIVISL